MKALSDAGQVAMPLGKTFFAPMFGMTTDRFGVLWMVVQAPSRVALRAHVARTRSAGRLRRRSGRRLPRLRCRRRGFP